MKKVTTCLFIAMALNACSPVMEANRPDPVDLKQFITGEPRANVLHVIGAPLATNKEGMNSCDLYKLYTKGPDALGKGAIAVGEALADVATIGLAEVIFTPTEAATKNTKYLVTFCYAPDDRLLSVTQSDTPTGD